MKVVDCGWYIVKEEVPKVEEQQLDSTPTVSRLLVGTNNNNQTTTIIHCIITFVGSYYNI